MFTKKEMSQTFENRKQGEPAVTGHFQQTYKVMSLGKKTQQLVVIKLIQ